MIVNQSRPQKKQKFLELSTKCDKMFQKRLIDQCIQSDSYRVCQQMQILNSKAYYLKNYTVRPRHKSYTKPKYSLTQPSTEQSNPRNDIMRIRNINRLPRVRSQVPSCLSHNQHTSNFVKKEVVPVSKDCMNIYEKQKSILFKLLKKQKELRKKKRSGSINSNYVVIENHPMGDIKSFEFEQMKPTDRYFHQMQNVRLAQRLLLVQPSTSICKKSLQKFYREQQKLKSSISKLSSYRQNPQQKTHKRRQLDRKKWMN